MARRLEGFAFLESGDRLTQPEFHRRYCKTPEKFRAELVEGVVYVSSPARMSHGESQARVFVWLGAYVAQHRNVRMADNATVILDPDNEVQPDALLMRLEPGGPRITDDDYIEGAPQLVVEVAVSSVSYDLHDKMRAYRRNGVREYIVWRVRDGAIDWFRLEDAEYYRVEPDETGVIESSELPGLRLNVPKMLAGDMAGVLAELRAD